MDISHFAVLIAKAKTFNNNFNDISYEDNLKYNILKSDSDAVIISDNSSPPEIYWAVKSADVLTKALLDLKGIYKIKALDTNIVKCIKNSGYKVITEYQDYFSEDIQSISLSPFNTSGIKFAQHKDVGAVSIISYACAGLSRGFNGETAEWFSEWLKEGYIIIHEENEMITGYCCISIYADGTIIWIRNIAVLPEHQNKGIGRKLIEKALDFGKNNGVQRAFLHVDKLNKNAIKLYRQYGFTARAGYEITLINQ